MPYYSATCQHIVGGEGRKKLFDVRIVEVRADNSTVPKKVKRYLCVICTCSCPRDVFGRASRADNPLPAARIVPKIVCGYPVRRYDDGGLMAAYMASAACRWVA